MSFTSRHRCKKRKIIKYTHKRTKKMKKRRKILVITKKKKKEIVILTPGSVDAIHQYSGGKPISVKMKHFSDPFQTITWTRESNIWKIFAILTPGSIDSIPRDSDISTKLEWNIFGTHFDLEGRKGSQMLPNFCHFDTGSNRFHSMRFDKKRKNHPGFLMGPISTRQTGGEQNNLRILSLGCRI